MLTLPILCRLREARNRLQHVSGTELTAAAFEQEWKDITKSLVRLGADQRDLYRLLTRDLDPAATRACVAEVQLFRTIDLFCIG